MTYELTKALSTEFQSFIDVRSIPTHGVVYARIADNILEPEDWNRYALTINRNIVVGQLALNPGVYAHTNMVGMTTMQLAEWTSWEHAGGPHPEETYHELAATE